MAVHLIAQPPPAGRRGEEETGMEKYVKPTMDVEELLDDIIMQSQVCTDDVVDCPNDAVEPGPIPCSDDYD